MQVFDLLVGLKPIHVLAMSLYSPSISRMQKYRTIASMVVLVNIIYISSSMKSILISKTKIDYAIKYIINQ